jgi:hypothetical protein
MIDRRAFIDPLSNVISPRGINLPRDLRVVISPPWPPQALLPFLHEFTHHWCYFSPVGATLAMLEMKALRLFLSKRIDAPELFDSFVSVRATLAFLEGISEGLALFAEFDMLPGKSRTCSIPMIWAGVFAMDRKSYAKKEDFFITLSSELTAARLHPYVVDRKLNCLLAPINEGDQSYLFGYLCIKRIWVELMKRDTLSTDTDFFLCYLRSFVFEDLGLVELLIRSIGSPHERIDLVTKRVINRISALIDGAFDREMHEFDEWHATTHPDDRIGRKYVPGLGMSEDEVNQGGKLLKDLQNDLTNPGSKGAIDEKLATTFAIWINRRGIARLAVEVIWVSCKDGRIALRPDDWKLEVPMMTGGIKLLDEHYQNFKETVGWINIVALPLNHNYGIVVGIDDVAIAFGNLCSGGRSGIPTPEELISYGVQSKAKEAEERALIQDFREVYVNVMPKKLSSHYDAVINVGKSRSKRLLEDIVDRWQLRSKGKSFSEQIQSEGIWHLGNGNSVRLKEMLTLGMMHELDVFQQDISMMLDTMFVDVNAALSHCQSVELKLGVELLWRNDERKQWLL